MNEFDGRGEDNLGRRKEEVVCFWLRLKVNMENSRSTAADDENATLNFINISRTFSFCIQ